MFKSFLPRLREKSLAAKRPLSIADLMEDFWREPMSAFPNLFKDIGYPAVDIGEKDGVVTVTAELPGLAPKDVTITIEGETLVLRGEKKFEDEEKKEDYHRIERSYGSFARVIPLPGKIKEGEVKARFDKGVLTVTLPRDEKDAPRSITIES
jgi:HSP20 family protein